MLDVGDSRVFNSSTIVQKLKNISVYMEDAYADVRRDFIECMEKNNAGEFIETLTDTKETRDAIEMFCYNYTISTAYFEDDYSAISDELEYCMYFLSKLSWILHARTTSIVYLNKCAAETALRRPTMYRSADICNARTSPIPLNNVFKVANGGVHVYCCIGMNNDKKRCDVYIDRRRDTGSVLIGYFFESPKVIAELYDTLSEFIPVVLVDVDVSKAAIRQILKEW